MKGMYENYMKNMIANVLSWYKKTQYKNISNLNNFFCDDLAQVQKRLQYLALLLLGQKSDLLNYISQTKNISLIIQFLINLPRPHICAIKHTYYLCLNKRKSYIFLCRKTVFCLQVVPAKP